MSEQTPEPTPVEVEEPAENESDLEVAVDPEPVEAPLEGDDAQEPQAVPEDGDTAPRTFDDEVAAADEDEPDLDAVE